MMVDDAFQSSLIILVVCSALFVRILVGYQHHSGEDNHHGSKRAYGGDYEAQRHWMEITYSLPDGDWYWYDREYWGLDYPPLTAYVSYICGAFSDWFVGPHTVALWDSRGYEGDPTHKAFMRATVWFLDAMVYFPAAYFILKTLWRSRKLSSKQYPISDYDFAATFLLALLQPSIILIDHGHFQYNTVALGLSLWSLYFIAHPNFYMSCIWGSIFFCLALNFKQMCLYYAPAIFAYLLGRCFANIFSRTGFEQCVERFAALGVTVIVTFALLWWPFIIYGPSSDETITAESDKNGVISTMIYRGKHVLHRIFPLERGLFEGKVSNLWCALDTRPINIRDRIPQNIQPLAALGATFSLMLPSCLGLFWIGKRPEKEQGSPEQQQLQQQSKHASDLKSLLWGTTSCALAFFLASFQVHEKSILLALAPASLLAWDDDLFCDWFAVVATWTMWPLLVVDRLQVAYSCCILIFSACVAQLRTPRHDEDGLIIESGIEWWSGALYKLSRALYKLSFAAMLGLHALEMVVTVPSHLPDLFPVLWSVVGCGLCCLAWLKTSGTIVVRCGFCCSEWLKAQKAKQS